MKPFIRNSILFLISFLLAYPFLIFLWGYTGANIFVSNVTTRLDISGYTFTRMQEARQTRDIDVLILGSSHAYNELDTRIFEDFGLRAFNLGSSAQTHIQTEILLERYLDQLNPEIVVYEVYPVIFTLDGVESGLDIIRADKNDKYSWKMAFQMNHLKIYNTLLFSVIQEKLGIKNYQEQPDKSRTYIPGGFVETEMAYFQPQMFPDIRFDYKEKQFRAFERVIAMMKERGIKVFLINAPVTSAYYKSLTGIPEFGILMESYGSYYDFNQWFPLDDSLYFYDKDHLNQRGVELFTQEVISIILSGTEPDEISSPWK